MASWLVVWFVLAIVSTAAVLACVLALLRHLLILGRTVKRLREEAQPIADDLAQEGRRAGAHMAAIGERRRTGTSGRPRG